MLNNISHTISTKNLDSKWLKGHAKIGLLAGFFFVFFLFTSHSARWNELAAEIVLIVTLLVGLNENVKEFASKSCTMVDWLVFYVRLLRTYRLHLIHAFYWCKRTMRLCCGQSTRHLIVESNTFEMRN